MNTIFNIDNLRGSEKNEPQKKNKFNFGVHKDNTLKSLREVNNFLTNFNQFADYITLYKILK